MTDTTSPMNFVFPAPPRTAVPIAGSKDFFPVRRIHCVGRNYADHVREMGGDLREPPFFFQKPCDAIVSSGAMIPYPPATADFHHEIELVLAIAMAGRDIKAADATRHVFGLAAGIDLTRRDLQARARKAGQPWEAAKAFDHSAPMGAILALAGRAIPRRGRISLNVNGEVRQDADLGDMIWAPDEIVCQLSQLYALAPGDLIFTGTPAGVGPLRPGDHVVGEIEQVGSVIISIS